MNTETDARMTHSDFIEVTKGRIKTIKHEIEAIHAKCQQEVAGLEAEKAQLACLIVDLTSIRTSNKPHVTSRTGKLSFRSNSKMARALPFIRQAGKPVTTVEVLQGIGEPVTPSSKATMAGDLYRASKKGAEIKNVGPGLFAFHKPVPASVEDLGKAESQESKDILLPDDFGK